MLENLKRLCNLDAPSGNEGTVREFIIGEIAPFCEYKIDNLGNIIAFKKGKKTPSRRIMLDAHTDEVGLIITNITADGFLKFSVVGGIDVSALLQRKVLINGEVNGVISCRPVHLLSSEQKKKLPSADSLYIDIGATTKEEAEGYVSLGDTAVICGEFLSQGERIISKALDDRAGCAVLIDLIKSYDEYDFYATFTAQEEVGLRGARVATYTVNPDCAIVLESTTAADISGVEQAKQVCKLGFGPAVSFMDKATLYDKAFYEAALSADIPCQVKTQVAGGNNSGAVHLSREGVRTIAISLPTRYLHTSSTVANVSDLKNMRKLAEYMLDGIASGEIK